MLKCRILRDVLLCRNRGTECGGGGDHVHHGRLLAHNERSLLLDLILALYLFHGTV